MSAYFVLNPTNPNKKAVWQNLVQAVTEMSSQGAVDVSIEKHKKSRTSQQNRYFWALCGLIANETGEDKEVIKMRLMHSLGFVIQAWSQGQAVIMPMSTTKLKTVEFGELIDATQSLCESLGIKYPLPQELGMNWHQPTLGMAS